MKEQYSELKKKHKLPDFSILDYEFEISSIEEEAFLLRNIRCMIDEKTELSIKLLDEILHPEAGFSSFRESGIFTQDERERILKVYRSLMYFRRLSTELFFEDSDELNAKFINEFMKEWPELKKSLLVFVKRMKESWQKDVSIKEVVGYLG
jgi:hypothetical protein